MTSAFQFSPLNSQIYPPKTNSGFTILEITVVLVIIVITTFSGFFAYLEFHDRSTLKQISQIIASYTGDIRNDSILAKDGKNILACEQKTGPHFYMAACFHPELTTTLFHEYFLRKLVEREN